MLLPEMSSPSNLLSEAAQIMTARMGVVGLVIGPVPRSSYLTMERIVPGAVKTAGFKKMLLYQILFAPLMIYFFFSV